MPELRLQNFVIARLADYCDFSARYSEEMRRDPVGRLWSKLAEIDAPLAKLKEQTLAETARAFGERLKSGVPPASDLADFKQMLDSYLSPGDFADASFALDDKSLSTPDGRAQAALTLAGLKSHSLLAEEKKPASARLKSWERLVADIHSRLDFPRLEKIAARKQPAGERRLRFILRRCRFNSADFCAVFRFPKGENDTFTPFILPRVEALVAANRRFLSRLRAEPAA